MLRFAISPSGDMHIGSLRVALFNYILSKQQNEDLLIRIDDTQKAKNVEGKEKEILEMLALFSIDYKTAVYQSENLKYHQKMAMQLMAQKKAFACFCSDEKLEELKAEAIKENKPVQYDDFCSTLSDETVLNCNAPFTVRIVKPTDKIQYNDTLKGNLTYKPSDVDAFVILSHDKSPTYNYACAVDDMIHNISTVLRDEGNTSNTSKQIHIRNLLGYDKEINYIHTPSLINKDISVKSLIDEGYLPSAIANYLVLIGNNTPNEIFSMEDAIEWFDIKNLSETPVEFDINKLQEINKKHLETMDEMRLSKILGFADNDIGKLAKLYLNEVSTLKELQLKIDSIFAPKTISKEFEKEFKLIQDSLDKSPFFNEFDELKTYITDKTGLQKESIDKPLYYLLTGRFDGPNINDIYPLVKNYLGEIIK